MLLRWLSRLRCVSLVGEKLHEIELKSVALQNIYLRIVVLRAKDAGDHFALRASVVKPAKPGAVGRCYILFVAMGDKFSNPEPG